MSDRVVAGNRARLVAPVTDRTARTGRRILRYWYLHPVFTGTAWLAFISRFKTSVYGEGEAADYIYRVAAILFGLDE